jgi:hypothetical protein
MQAKKPPISAVQYARQNNLSLDFVYRQLRVGRITGEKVGKTWAVDSCPACTKDAKPKK